MPETWEWAVTIALDVVAVGGIAAGWYLGEYVYVVVGILAAAMALGFGRSVKRS